ISHPSHESSRTRPSEDLIPSSAARRPQPAAPPVRPRLPLPPPARPVRAPLALAPPVPSLLRATLAPTALVPSKFVGPAAPSPSLPPVSGATSSWEGVASQASDGRTTAATKVLSSTTSFTFPNSFRVQMARAHRARADGNEPATMHRGQSCGSQLPGSSMHLRPYGVRCRGIRSTRQLALLRISDLNVFPHGTLAAAGAILMLQRDIFPYTLPHQVASYSAPSPP
ncbi:unnamed protein product, partial [Urochloa humidicola]